MATVTKESIEKTLREKLEAEHVEVVDTSGGCGNSFDVVIVSSIFEGKSILQKHRLVNEACKSEIAQLHAFSQNDKA
ncbi:9986_t:CDS:2 [Diversispora eburnea]|uniref:9986_t:CDS:1 n=1 Tax=Diversispora eburnea TaxID=1213867 RepID=A0A9N8Z8Q9_9GLOM|nr:9986_t:CDS:2 [Diversispora eburnea]